MASARMGEMIISAEPDDELVALGLGSCIGLAMVDRRSGVAGLAHVVLPESGSADGPAAKFADLAVPALLDSVIARGATRGGLQIVIAGGASMFASAQQLDIGARNDAAVRAALGKAGLRCAVAATGGRQGRTIRVHVGSGTVTSRTAGQEPIQLLPTPLPSRAAARPALRKVA